jgi:3-oxoacyl-(acyl-carrier-protein) synthase
MKRRVVVTGVGVISPNGIGNEACWKGMINGVSGVKRVTESEEALRRLWHAKP